MSEIHITVNGGLYRYGPGVVRIGRSSENDIVINDPTVSRRHAQISLEADGWTWQNLGQAPTFLGGQPVVRFVVADLVDINLASPQGPAIRLQAVTDTGPPVATGPMHGDVARPGVPGPGVAGPGLVGPGLAGPGLAGPGLAGPGAPAAVAAAPAGVVPGAPAGPGAPGGPGHPGGPAGAGYPGGPAGPGGSGYPGGPGGAGAPGGLAPGGPGRQAGFPPGRPPADGAGYPGPPGIPGFPGFGAAAGVPQLDATTLERGSFFETLIPIKSWLHDKGWRQGLRLLIIPYALLPLIFLQVFSMAKSLATPGWAYSIYVAPLWLIVFWYLIKPPRWGRTEVWFAVGVVIWEFIWLHLVTGPINGHLVKVSLTHPLTLPRALIVGFNEETSKALPVLLAAALLLGIRKRKLDPRTWMIMGTIAGLTFGVIEQAGYTPAALAIVARAHNVPQADFGALDFAFRVFVDGFQHAVWAGVSGFFIGMAINYRRRRVPMLIVGITIPALLHALNDWTLTIFHTVWVTVVFVQGLSLLLFLGYTLSAADIERRVRRNPAFRGQSIIMERFSQP